MTIHLKSPPTQASSSPCGASLCHVPPEVEQIQRQTTDFLRHATRGLTEDTLRFLVVQAEEMELAVALKSTLLEGGVEAVILQEARGKDHVSTDDFLLRLREGSDT